MGKHVEDLVVKECKASEFSECDIVFSGLDADVAGEIGEHFHALKGGHTNGGFRDGVFEG